MSASERSGPSSNDHYQLNFWLWVCIEDGEDFLRTSKEKIEISAKYLATNPSLADMRAYHTEDLILYRELNRRKYHFITAIGFLTRVLKHSCTVYPELIPMCDAAMHFFAEGKALRDMVEHADDYMRGAGNRQAGFIREGGLASNLPGDAPGVSTALGLVVDDSGHWLGGRLNVEKVLAELRPILDVANGLPVPQTDLMSR